ncbi:EcsC family protein [Nocardioides cynanchi]|uniref:EcsC family protein n=1 Tax=Nocardioides cynanchi TaxID=2558918 RepID=UPI0012484D91|nr:EcsC family protein [Nocardioides cynanchi]
MRSSKRSRSLEPVHALDLAASQTTDDNAVSRLVQVLLDAGIDGIGPLSSSREIAAAAVARSRSNDAAIARVARSHLARGAVGGFVTGIGGFVTMPIALPVNVVEFYVLATRMVGSIAVLRGYDVDEPRVRTAILLTLVGADADEVLAKAGLATGGGRALRLVSGQLPPAALLMLNKAIAFRLMRGVGEKAFVRLGRGVPVVGGVMGSGIDSWMMKRIADHAMGEFPPLADA